MPTLESFAKIHAMKPVIQEDATGCGIAAAAAAAGVTYRQANRVAKSLGIFAHDKDLWSETYPVRKLLKYFGIGASPGPMPFRSWDSLPDLALLSIKWHREAGKPFWHWVVFVRANGKGRVLDSKKALCRHTRTDFGRMKPKWYIGIKRAF